MSPAVDVSAQAGSAKTPPAAASSTPPPSDRWTIKLVDRYIAGQLSQLVLFGLVLFSLAWFVPETLFRLIQAVVEGRMNLVTFGQISLLYIPEVLQQAIPMAATVASVLLFRRLSLDFELTALFTAGVSGLRLARPLLAVGLCLVALHFTVQEYILPQTHPVLVHQLDATGVKGKKEPNFVFFERHPDSEHRLEKLFIAGRASGNTAQDVFWLYFRPKEQTPLATADAERLSRIQAILKADTATWYADRSAWLLRDGVEYELDAEGIYKGVNSFKTQWVLGNPFAYQLMQFSQREPANLSINELGTYMDLLRKSAQLQALPFYEVRWHQKIALPLANAFLVLMGAALGNEPARSRKLLSQVFAALVLFLYLVSIPIATNLGMLGLLPPVIAGWLPLSLASIATYVMVQARRRSFGG